VSKLDVPLVVVVVPLVAVVVPVVPPLVVPPDPEPASCCWSNLFELVVDVDVEVVVGAAIVLLVFDDEPAPEYGDGH
jgi:hypothetical protein